MRNGRLVIGLGRYAKGCIGIRVLLVQGSPNARCIFCGVSTIELKIVAKMTTAIQKLLTEMSPSEAVQEIELGRSQFFDDVAATFVRLSKAEAALVILVGPDELHVVGAHGGEFSNFPRSMSRTSAKPYEVMRDFDSDYPASHLVNGMQARAKSAVFCALKLHDQNIGSIVGLSSERRSDFSDMPDDLVKLADITSDVLREKIAFKLMLADVFALANV